MIEKLKEKIIAANPEIIGDWSGCEVCGTMCGICDDRFFKEKIGRPIRLADVLLAMKNDNIPLVEEDSWNVKVGTYDVATLIQIWNLKDDNLDEQSIETIQFLYDLLVGGDV